MGFEESRNHQAKAKIQKYRVAVVKLEPEPGRPARVAASRLLGKKKTPLLF
jgi:hypothetical protein